MLKALGLIALFGTVAMSQDQDLDKNVLWAYRYPGATLLGTGSAGMTATSGVYETSDPYTKVYAHYARLAGVPGTPKGGVAATATVQNRNQGMRNPTSGLVQEWGGDVPSANFVMTMPGSASVVTIQGTEGGTRIVVMMSSGGR
jgi:hypothetical protein